MNIHNGSKFFIASEKLWRDVIFLTFNPSHHHDKYVITSGKCAARMFQQLIHFFCERGKGG
jgi:hypothetical protein